MSRRRSTRLAIAGFAVCMLLGSAAFAAPGDDDSKKAQDAFIRATREFGAGDFRAAAQDFEEAYRLKPHHDPLWNAARSWQRAGESVRAANLYARYLRLAPAGTKDRDTATSALTELSAKLGKITAHSSGPTELKVDDQPNDPDGLYVTPGEHVVSGLHEGKPVRKSVTLSAGQTLSVTLEPPPPPPTIVVAPPPARPERPPGFHLPWIVVAVGGALTLGAAGVTVWSGLDSRTKRNEFRDRYDDGTATQDELDDGKATQTRTNVLIGVTAGLAALTGISALFVDWGGSSKASLAVQPSLGGLVVRYTN
ncbi:MAG: hypothetical protein U0270_38425 [Labilithrix sp.]